MGFWDIVSANREEAKCKKAAIAAFKYHQEMARQMSEFGGYWFRTKQGVEYKINDEFIGIKMTKEEAINIFIRSQIKNSNPQTPIFVTTREYAEVHIAGLEALGLIKFEEPRNEYIHLVPEGHTTTVELNKEAVIRFLRSIGYKVEKI